MARTTTDRPAHGRRARAGSNPHRRRRGSLSSVLAGIAAIVPADAATKERLDVEIGSAPYALEIVTEVPEGKAPETGWPIALITHGAAGSSPHESVGPDLLDRWVRFFSGRGYYAVAAARRGYATSDGPVFEVGDSCREPAVDAYIDAQADDLAAVVERIGERPEADARRVVAIGQSAGGAAVLGLNGRLEGLAAIVNVAGGVYRWEDGVPAERYAVFDGCERYRRALVDAIGGLDARGDTSSLWIYTANDAYFDPELVGEMAEAWRAADAAPAPVLQILPRSDNSHRLFIWDEGPQVMRASIDRFLRDHGLPAESASLRANLERCLPLDLRPEALAWFEEQNHRVLAISGDGGRLFAEDTVVSPEAARAEALATCSAQAGAGCRLLAEDETLYTEACPQGGGADE